MLCEVKPGKVLENALDGDDSLGEEQGVSGGKQQANQKKPKQARHGVSPAGKLRIRVLD